MKPSVEQLGNLLALKRHEGPEEGYWPDFLREFHQHQREQAVKKLDQGLLRRASEWFSSLGSTKWAYGAGLAYAAIAVSMILNPREVGKDNLPAAPVNYQVVPVTAPPPAQQLDQLDLSPTTQGNPGEQVF